MFKVKYYLELRPVGTMITGRCPSKNGRGKRRRIATRAMKTPPHEPSTLPPLIPALLLAATLTVPKAHRAGTYLATFRAVARVYPSMPKNQILADLIAMSPGDEGKWFATAKELGFYDVALRLVSESPCDPKTLARAACDFAERQSKFALGSGLAALHWLARGHGYEIGSLDVWTAYHSALKATEQLGSISDTKAVIRQIALREAPGGIVRQVLGRELQLA